MPAFGENGVLNLLGVVAAVHHDHDALRSVCADVLVQLQRLQGRSNPIMLRFIAQFVFLAIVFAVKRNRGTRDETVVEEQDNVRSLMPDHRAASMIESLGVLCMESSPALECAVDQQRD